MTYISQKMNALRQHGGLGPHMFNVAGEPADNLTAHLLDEQAGEPSIPKLLVELQALCDQEKPPNPETYMKFVETRAHKIGAAFIKWIQDLEGSRPMHGATIEGHRSPGHPEPAMFDDWTLECFVDKHLLLGSELKADALLALRALRLQRTRRLLRGEKARLEGKTWSSVKCQLLATGRLTLEGGNLAPAARFFGEKDKLHLPPSEWVSMVASLAAAFADAGGADPKVPQRKRLKIVLDAPKGPDAASRARTRKSRRDPVEFWTEWEAKQGSPAASAWRALVDAVEQAKVPGFQTGHFHNPGAPWIGIAGTRIGSIKLLRLSDDKPTISDQCGGTSWESDDSAKAARDRFRVILGGIPDAKKKGRKGCWRVPVLAVAMHRAELVDAIRRVAEVLRVDGASG